MSLDTDFLDEILHFSIHEHDFNNLTKKEQDFLNFYRDLEFYPKSKKKGKKIDKVVEFKKCVNEYLETITLNDGNDSNEECMIIQKMVELLNKMMVMQVRQLKLEKLIGKK